MRAAIVFFPQDRIRQLAAASIFAAAFFFPLSARATEEAADGANLMAAAPAPIAAPPIERRRLDGAPFSLAGRKGEFTLINFWALWCAPCKREMPALGRLHARMAGRGLEVIAVNLGDRPANIRRFLKQTGTGDLPVVLDPDGRTSRDWHVQGLPATFLVGPGGTITHVALGAREWSADAALGWFEQVLGRTGN